MNRTIHSPPPSRPPAAIPIHLPMSECRAAHRIYTAANGDRRKIEIVRGKAYSAAQHKYLVYARSPERQQPAPPRRGADRQAASKWCFSDPEMKRRRRVAGYKIYAVEGKVKSSLRRGVRWIKSKCSELVHGW
ncbi:hypothetical protein KSP40_PGU017218 [Platanthera guangdongensis]|uniref:Uncharacterized protein n=1 Tax=Platanthera guangdongensis TaxID=2320717 RepID=A0ABR2M835_9ASPA